jgi:nitroreductase
MVVHIRETDEPDPDLHVATAFFAANGIFIAATLIKRMKPSFPIYAPGVAIMTLSASEANALKHAPAVEGVLPVILERWSPRAFADRDVSPEVLMKVFEAARWAPSSNNEQPWRFVVGMRNSETYNKVGSSLVPFNQAWALHAPVLILGLAKTTFSQKETPNNYAIYDLGAASALITIEAASLGLVTHQMAGFDQTKAREVLGIPDGYALGSVMALGYQGEPVNLKNENHLASEIAPRTRKPLSEIVLSSWNEPARLF